VRNQKRIQFIEERPMRLIGLTAWKEIDQHIVTFFTERMQSIAISLFVCRSACLFICLYPTGPNLAKFYLKCYMWPWFGPPWQRNTLCISGFVDDVMLRFRLQRLPTGKRSRRKIG